MPIVNPFKKTISLNEIFNTAKKPTIPNWQSGTGVTGTVPIFGSPQQAANQTGLTIGLGNQPAVVPNAEQINQEQRTFEVRRDRMSNVNTLFSELPEDFQRWYVDPDNTWLSDYSSTWNPTTNAPDSLNETVKAAWDYYKTNIAGFPEERGNLPPSTVGPTTGDTVPAPNYPKPDTTKPEPPLESETPGPGQPGWVEPETETPTAPIETPKEITPIEEMSEDSPYLSVDVAGKIKNVTDLLDKYAKEGFISDDMKQKLMNKFGRTTGNIAQMERAQTRGMLEAGGIGAKSVAGVRALAEPGTSAMIKLADISTDIEMQNLQGRQDAVGMLVNFTNDLMTREQYDRQFYDNLSIQDKHFYDNLSFQERENMKNRAFDTYVLDKTQDFEKQMAAYNRQTAITLAQMGYESEEDLLGKQAKYDWLGDLLGGVVGSIFGPAGTAVGSYLGGKTADWLDNEPEP